MRLSGLLAHLGSQLEHGVCKLVFAQAGLADIVASDGM